MTTNGTVVALCISPTTKEPMQLVDSVEAIAGQGLRGDRYASAEGSFNRGTSGERQVTLINALFFDGSGFEYVDSRRNIVTRGVELMWLIGRDFQIGQARFRGVKYCDPCDRPSKLSGRPGFRERFQDRGGLVAEVLEGGLIKIGDSIIPPSKGY